ncbi:MAG: DMT family transporter [Rubrobacteraceae bacterium]|jgi:drug/metabolite transporter (DMT)-like permease|nr:DMT family transporter [Rubrobacteraceae bacterium]
MRPKDLGALMLLGALWGGSFLFIRVAVPALGPFVLMELRVGLAVVALTLYVVVVGRLSKLRSRWREFLIIGTVNTAIPFSLIAAAEIYLTASLAAILNSTTVLFTALVAAVWMGDPLTRRKVVGVILGIVGVAVLVGWDPIELSGVILLSVGAMLAASLSYALGAVYIKRTFKGIPPLSMSLGQLTGGAIILLPLAAASLPGERPSAAVTLCVLGLALLSTAVAYLLYFRLIENVGPTSTVTVTLLVPLFGLLFGVLLLDEPFGWGTLAGLAIILSSVTLVTGIDLGGTREEP